MNGRNGTHDDRDGQSFELDITSMVQIPVKNGPISDIGISPDGSRLFVTNYGRNSVSVIDTDSCRVLQTVAGLDEPFAIALSGGDVNRAYVSTVSQGSMAYDSIEVIDVATHTRIATHQLALSVSDLTVSADGKYIYASRNGAHGADVAVVDTTSGELDVIELATVPGTTTECVRISSDGSRLYVGTNGPSGGHLVVIETRAQSNDGRLRIVGTIELGLPLRDVALSNDGGTAYVASCGPVVGAVLDVIDTHANKITSTRKVDEVAGPLTRLTLSGDGRHAYLVSDDRITVLCTRTHDVVGDVRVAKQPSCVVESPDGEYLYIADYSGVVTVAPVASTSASGIEAGLEQGNSPTEWTVPLGYEAALA